VEATGRELASRNVGLRVCARRSREVVEQAQLSQNGPHAEMLQDPIRIELGALDLDAHLALIDEVAGVSRIPCAEDAMSRVEFYCLEVLPEQLLLRGREGRERFRQMHR